jgi:hypothetical protein
MFAVEDVAAVSTSRSLAEAYHDDEALSDVRVWRPDPCSSEGDIFGPPSTSPACGVDRTRGRSSSGDVHDVRTDDEALH